MVQIEEVSWLEHRYTINSSSVSIGMYFVLSVIVFITHFRAWRSQDYSSETTVCTSLYYTTFFTPRINEALQSFAAAWNHHPMRTERHWSPFQMWTNGVLDIRNHSLVGISDIAESGGDVDDLEWYGYDPFVPTPSDDGLSTVEVEDVNIDLPIDILTLLRQNIDPLQHSDSFGIDLFQNGLVLLMQAGE